MNTYRKGWRNEKRAMALFERAGCITHRAKISRFNKNDFFGQFDFVALGKEKRNCWVQVKSNSASKAVKKSMKEFASKYFESNFNLAILVVWKDRKGWEAFHFNDNIASAIFTDDKTQEIILETKKCEVD